MEHATLYPDISSRKEWYQAMGGKQKNDPAPLPRPELGARVMATPFLTGAGEEPQPGTVTYVHETHFWYQVTFDAGYRQSYKWGETK